MEVDYTSSLYYKFLVVQSRNAVRFIEFIYKFMFIQAQIHFAKFWKTDESSLLRFIPTKKIKKKKKKRDRVEQASLNIQLTVF